MTTFINDAHSSGFIKVSGKEICRWPSGGLPVEGKHTPQAGDVYLSDGGDNRPLPQGLKAGPYTGCPGVGRYIEIEGK